MKVFPEATSLYESILIAQHPWDDCIFTLIYHIKRKQACSCS